MKGGLVKERSLKEAKKFVRNNIIPKLNRRISVAEINKIARALCADLESNSTKTYYL